MLAVRPIRWLVRAQPRIGSGVSSVRLWSPGPSAKARTTAARSARTRTRGAGRATAANRGRRRCGSWRGTLVGHHHDQPQRRPRDRATSAVSPNYAACRCSRSAAARRPRPAPPGSRTCRSADGDADDLVRLIVSRRARRSARRCSISPAPIGPPTWLGSLRKAGLLADMVVIYRAVAAHEFPSTVRDALAAGQLDGVLHLSRRSAEIYLACARRERADRPRAVPTHYCLSAQVAEPLVGGRRPQRRGRAPAGGSRP